MHRTTIALNDELYRRLEVLAKQENRSIPNLIETTVLRQLQEDLYVETFEMDEIGRDAELRQSIEQGLADYKAGKGRIV